jgi:hypothetical protein
MSPGARARQKTAALLMASICSKASVIQLSAARATPFAPKVGPECRGL